MRVGEVGTPAGWRAVTDESSSPVRGRPSVWFAFGSLSQGYSLAGAARLGSQGWGAWLVAAMGRVGARVCWVLLGA